MIGTNSLDAKSTVAAMLEDHAENNLQAPANEDICTLLAERAVDAVSWNDWLLLDEWERQQGEQRGKLRHKLASVQELMNVIAELRAK